MDMKKIHDLLNDKFDDADVNEEDLEDELEAILSGKPLGKGSRAPAARPVPAVPQKTRPKRPPTENVYKNVGSSKPLNDPMLDISSIEKMLNNFDIENVSDGDEDNNLNDHDLLSELDNIVNNSASRHSTNESSSSAGASESPKRPLPVFPDHFQNKTTQLKIQKVEEVLKPNITSIPAKVLPSLPLPEEKIPILNVKEQKTAQIKQLQIEYKKAALKAKTIGDKENALAHLKVSKQLDIMINSLNAGETVDMSKLPPLPLDSSSKPSQNVAPSVIMPTETTSVPLEQFDVTQEEESAIFHAPKSVGSVSEALQQRLEKFKSTQAQASAEQNEGKARRLGRIVKQYETAVKDYKAKKPIDLDALPCPPGFPPFPGSSSEVTPSPKPVAVEQPRPNPQVRSTSNVEPPKPSILLNPKTESPKPNQPNQTVTKPPLKRGLSTTGSKQLKFLIERQKLFREAALEAKKRGELEQAKEYLRTTKGFDPLIEATKSGLPIDVTTIPTPPQLNNDDFVIVDEEIDKTVQSFKRNSVFYTDMEKEEFFRKIELELKDQINMCNRNKEYFLKMGDINTSSKFEKFAKDGDKDLNMLRVRWRNGDNVPSYKTETRTFSIVVSNHEVGVNELQVDILKAFDIPGKPEIDTYVKVEFPVPAEKPQIKKTKTVYNTINPEYNESIKFEIDRKSRSLARILKRHPLKLEVFSKGGFLRSDTLLGTIQIKLSDLETKCTIHECVQLVEARKTLHTRLEVKIKLREPLLAKQIEEIKEKWIVFT